MKFFYVGLAAMMLFYSCAKEIGNPDPADAPKSPSVLTLNATNISSDSAVLNGEVVCDNNETISRGFYWSRLPDPGNDSMIICSKGTGLFCSTITGLNDSVTYYYRAFAINAAGSSTGEVKSFTTLDKKVPFSGRLVSNSGCLQNSNGRQIRLADSLSCAHYSFDAASHILRLTHYNAGFNCCDYSMSCEVTMNNDTIFIREVEGTPICNCLCLFNLEIEVTGVNPQNYIIQFIEPYVWNHEYLIFPVDLSSTPTGDECITRHFSPWYY